MARVLQVRLSRMAGSGDGWSVSKQVLRGETLRAAVWKASVAECSTGWQSAAAGGSVRQRVVEKCRD